MRGAALVLAGALLLAACGGEPDTFDVAEAEVAAAADYSYTIPAGAGDAYDRGAPLEILPASLTVRVGQVIEIVNEDERGHLVGPFYVGAGEVLRQRFASPGEYVGVCTVHPSGEISLFVDEP